ncbi:WSC-domain-containing protein, partial [Auricularia subglabra TFB-10046 SS5]
RPRRRTLDAGLDDGRQVHGALQVQGLPFAGLEWAQECWCDNKLDESKVGNYACDMPPATTRRRPRPPFHYYYYYYPQQQNTGVVKPPAPTSQPAKPTYTTQPPLKETTNPTKPAPTTAAVSGFTSLGCFVDSQSARTLRGTALFSAGNMTPATCASRCKSAGFKFAGVEYGKECFCGNEIVNQKKAADAVRSTACAGDAKARCGAGNRINIYQSTAATSARVPAGTGLWAGAPLTPAVCTARCASLGYKLAGVEYGKARLAVQQPHTKQKVDGPAAA